MTRFEFQLHKGSCFWRDFMLTQHRNKAVTVILFDTVNKVMFHSVMCIRCWQIKCQASRKMNTKSAAAVWLVIIKSNDFHRWWQHYRPITLVNRIRPPNGVCLNWELTHKPRQSQLTICFYAYNRGNICIPNINEWILFSLCFKSCRWHEIINKMHQKISW